MMEVQTRQVRSLPLQHAVCPLLRRGIVHEDVHVLDAREPAHNLAVHPRDRLKLLRPVLWVMRPRNPRSGMGSPLGGHTKLTHLSSHSHIFILVTRVPPESNVTIRPYQPADLTEWMRMRRELWPELPADEAAQRAECDLWL